MSHALNLGRAEAVAGGAGHRDPLTIQTAASLGQAWNALLPVAGDLDPAPKPEFLSVKVGDRFRVSGDRERQNKNYILGSSKEFFAANNFYRAAGFTSVDEAVATFRADSPDEPDVYAIQEAGVIVSGELAQRGLRPNPPTLVLALDQVIEVEGRPWRVTPSANGNICFKEIGGLEVAAQQPTPAPTLERPVSHLGPWLVPMEARVTREMVAKALSLANEGGVGYWAEGADFIDPPGKVTFRHFQDMPPYDFVDFPLNGGATLLRVQGSDRNQPPLKIDAAAIKRGLEVMAQMYPSHFRDLISYEFAVKETGDVFVQCCVFGEIVFDYHRDNPYR